MPKNASRKPAPGPSPDPALVYSEDRVRRIRIVLYVVLGFSALVVLIAALTLLSVAQARAAETGTGATTYSLVLAGVAVVLLASTAVAMRLLPERGQPAKRAATVTGVLLILFGLLLSSIWIGLVMPLLGLAVLLVALLPDQDHL